VLRSDGDGPFCAGASFDELLAIKTFEQGKEFFMGFARLILAMKNCPKFVIARVQGKAVGGGVGVVAAADYALASNQAAIKLSELALGFGPFVIGPAVERKIGPGNFSALAMDTGWREAAWAKAHGLYTDIFSSVVELDAALTALAEKLSRFNPEAMARLKTVFWQGTEHWEKLLETRAEMSGKLVLSEFTRGAIRAFKQK
jgi:methylglutaconyl-CoA hydratase